MKELESSFSISQPDLAQLGIEAVRLWDRDKVQFVNYGKDQAWRDALNVSVQAYSATPRDMELVGQVMLATEAKNVSRKDVEKRVRTLLVKAQNEFGNNGINYRTFKPQSLTNLTDTNLRSHALSAHRLATAYLVSLANQGVVQQELDDMAQAIKGYSDNIDKKSEAIQDRDMATNDRAKNGNALYNSIVDLFDCGRDAWRYSNEAKYNDYVIYSTPQGAAPAVVLYDNVVDVNETINMISDATTNQRSIEVTNNGAGSLWMCQTGAVNNVCGIGGTEIPSGQTIITVVSQMNGAGDFVNITNPSGQAIAAVCRLI